jgi:hypothetical protein
MNSLGLLNTTSQIEGYESINLEEESGISFLRENAQMIVDDCLDLLDDLDGSVSKDNFADKNNQVQTLYDTICVLLDNLAEGRSESDSMVKEVETTYNKLMSEYEEITQLYAESADFIENTKDNDVENETTENEWRSAWQDTESDDADQKDFYHQKSRVSKKIMVLGGEEFSNIKIGVLINEPKVIHNRLNSTPLVKNPDSLPNATISALEKRDPVTKVIYSPSFTALEKVETKAKISSWNNYINKEEIVSMLGPDFSLKVFTRRYENRIYTIEQDSVDLFERWLGEARANVYDYLKNMTLEEVDILIEDTALKSTLKINNLKYETFIRWVDEYRMINNFINLNKSALFGELVCLYVALELAEKQPKFE